MTASAVGTFTVQGESKSGNNFRVARNAAGGYTRSCDTAGQGGCKTGGIW